MRGFLSALGFIAIIAGSASMDQAAAQEPQPVISADALLDPAPRTIVNAAFVLGPGDLIELNVQGEAGGRQQVRVGEDGRILAPLIGLFSVAGLTPEDAVDALADAYVQGDWLNAPQISMTLIDGRPYYVAGDVRQPGAYPSRPRMTVEEALAIAGGFRFRRISQPA